MCSYRENSFDEVKLSEVIRISARYHGSRFWLGNCDYMGICPGDRDFLRLLSESGMYLYIDKHEVERFCDEDIKPCVARTLIKGFQYHHGLLYEYRGVYPQGFR